MENSKHSHEFNSAVYADTLLPDDSNIDEFLERVRELFELVKGEGGRLKHKDGDFRLTDRALSATASTTGLPHNETYRLLASALEGAIRPQSTRYLFNIMPTPHLDAVAASTLASLLNTNTLMDRYAGNLLQVEQNVSRTIGTWAGWRNSFGISCAGGKATMIYAVRAALSRLAPSSRVEGVPRNVVVLANEMAHYVVEDICTLLGLGSGACRRVNCKEPWSMDPELISRAICDAHSEGKQIAAVICCGGTTINSCVDNLQQVVQACNRTLQELGCSYRPYFHLDAVIGWLWLAFRDDAEARKQLTPAVRRSVEDFLRKLEGLECFDSFGADLHKDGLCPISGSFFICREFETLDSLTNGQVTLEPESLVVNDWRPYRYTLENSRPGGGILAAWAVLNRLGRRGFQEYLIHLLESSDELKRILESKGFSVVNNYSKGWEIAFEIPFNEFLEAAGESPLCESQLDQLKEQFIAFVWKSALQNTSPYFSYIPSFRAVPSAYPRIVFLLYPMNVHLTSDSREVLVNEIVELVRTFVSQRRAITVERYSSQMGAPIR